ncbi:hypothetical protein XFF6166_680011 [Xanthomonas citri pv. fuscans]|nr:hypothetical protein XFF6166_680011 [Xanthomonas citri pv. fuscans]SOO06065.1 hypothetical protein XFF7767_610011 [Xanthomonas citri pv. fuscans]SOO08337.1 hypothetical protein XFF6970_200011 [Xanthomonas citri pv. fuscans]SOO13342.1 hypothetical protein XFF7766_160009 [Xanthomonas citri pv. fuscans]SOO44139.1 hypothetical protein XFF1815_450011 [Xanthomonas citri pv. fuscans]
MEPTARIAESGSRCNKKAPAVPGLFCAASVETIAKSATPRSAPGRERIPDNPRRARVRSYEDAMAGRLRRSARWPE